jgi:GT2 family glycosyltransferase
MDLSILIVNWNTRELLRKCLQSIYATAGELAMEVWVVDNASIDDSVSMIRECFPQVHLIENRENLGFARANNQAIRASHGRYVLLLNSDTEVYASALKDLIDALQSHPEAGAAGPKMLNPDGTFQSSFGFLPSVWSEIFGPYLLDFLTKPWGRIGARLVTPDHHDGACTNTDRVSFACTLIRRETLQATGLLDETYVFYSEDYDWFKRAHDAGWQVLFCPHAQVMHHWGASSRQSSDWSISQLYRSKRLYFIKHYGRNAEKVLRGGLCVRFAVKYGLAVLAYPMQAPASQATMRRCRILIREMLHPL